MFGHVTIHRLAELRSLYTEVLGPDVAEHLED